MSDFNFVCNVHHRNSAGNGYSRQLHIEAKPGLAMPAPKTVHMGDFQVSADATRPSEFETGSFNITVGLREPTSQPMSQLYQFSKPPQNEFLGGHGFTGLNYVNHPNGEDQLQFRCSHSQVDSQALAGMRAMARDVDRSSAIDRPAGRHRMERFELWIEVPVGGTDVDAYVSSDQFYVRSQSVPMTGDRTERWYGPFSVGEAREKAQVITIPDNENPQGSVVTIPDNEIQSAAVRAAGAERTSN